MKEITTTLEFVHKGTMEGQTITTITAESSSSSIAVPGDNVDPKTN